VRVKVCGITNYEDAALALDLGVDALGFNLYRKSSRYTDPVEVRRIIRRLPPLCTTVGLFVNVPDSRDVADLARTAGVQVLQLHGDEPAGYCRELSDWPLVKALRMGKGRALDNLEDYPVQAFLLDAHDDRLYGGTGRTFDWRLAEGIGRIRPVILAGGLNTDNVAAAIREVKPYGIDVCSGVEQSPGHKDPQKLTAFMSEVRKCL
jgi:phosphoribosylanthranilate isomerase